MTAVYVDEARTHSVRVSLEGRTLTIVESAVGEVDPAAAVRSTHEIVDGWELTYHRAELEARLAQLGAYWKSDGGAWHRVPVARRIDVEPIRLGQAGLHHYHHPGKVGRTLLTLPARVVGRSVLAELETEGLEAVDGRLLHASIADGPLRSLIARVHAEATRSGYAKLRAANEFSFLYGDDWQTKLARLVTHSATRLAKGEALVPPAPKVVPQAPTAVIVPPELLAHPRLGEIHACFLAPGEEDDLLLRGEHAIRRAVTLKRKTASAAEQHLLSILEASLLVREGARDHTLVETEIIDRVHRLEFYLK